jgi:serine/threonine protein kinase
MEAIASILQPLEPPLETDECAPGALLGGKYRLERLLGEGGMANVWLARNEFLDLPVALKIVRPQIRGSETAARLLTEARVQANLRHPNVARVYDYGQTQSGDAFIVMELLEGYSLAEWLEREGALSPVIAVQIMLPVIDALCAAHRAGVIHRDLKPDNIFISHPTTDLCPKLLDFGIAKINTEFNPRLTGQGGVIGSPAYMAPEQARGLVDCDERVDVWAACVVLYEAITGKPAFDGSNHLALMLAVIEEELEPLAGPGCEDLWPILDAGLRKEREQRTSSMMVLGGQLAKWLAERGAKQDLGGEPVHWRYAFTVKDADAVAPVAALARATGPRLDSSSHRIELGEKSRRSASERRRPSERHGHDRRSPTPLTTVRRGLETVSISPAAIRKAAAFRLATAAFVGAGLIALGVTQGPLSWLAPRPDAAFALGAAKAEPYIAQPAKPEQLTHAAQPELMPVVDSPAIATAEAPAEVKADPKPAHQQLLTRSVRQAPELAQLARRAAEESETRAELEDAPTKLANAEPKSERMHLEVAAFVDPKDAAPTTDATKAPEIVVASRPASNVVTVRPRAKQALPSEAELGLKNPW